MLPLFVNPDINPASSVGLWMDRELGGMNLTLDLLSGPGTSRWAAPHGSASFPPVHRWHQPTCKREGGQRLHWPDPELWQNPPEAGIHLGGHLGKSSVGNPVGSTLWSIQECSACLGSAALGAFLPALVKLSLPIFPLFFFPLALLK